ncbi:metallophosphoesterase [Candidatus Micrarchaeota archaeon]|nr:metallophosphoesterase [Candidatus Micrarchaeota archaeon]MBU1166053.1 metallophosphoesterase [Candidatus Micrarchaeota archaeon]MBU1886884.1 metallophosphoesterase [Candidatus Micrarchaeota archaeon]
MKFIYDAPAIFHKDALILGDTHFGMERKLRNKGIYDEQFSERLFLKLKELILKYKAKKVIFLGDVKEEITMLDEKTRNILSRLSLICEIIIVRGNHDGGIENCGCAKIIPSEGFVYCELGLAHGHSWPEEELMKCKYIVLGHQHPMIGTKDSMGKIHKEPVWIVAEPEEKNISEHYKEYNTEIKLILMPAFNPLVGAVIKLTENNITKEARKSFQKSKIKQSDTISNTKLKTGPLLNNKIFKLASALVLRLDGTRLGKLEKQVETYGKKTKRT